MELLRRMGGMAGLLIIVAGAAITRFAPQHTVWGWVLIGAGLVPLLGAIWLNRQDLSNLAKGRPFRHGANAVFYSLLVLGIVGAVDFLAARHTRRFDLTETGRHSVSQQTIQILQSLGSEVSRWCLVTAIAGIGMKTQLKDLASVGLKPVVLMLGETLFLVVLVLGLMRWLT